MKTKKKKKNNTDRKQVPFPRVIFQCSLLKYNFLSRRHTLACQFYFWYCSEYLNLSSKLLKYIYKQSFKYTFEQSFKHSDIRKTLIACAPMKT